MDCKTYLEISAEISGKRISYQERDGISSFNLSDFDEVSYNETLALTEFFKIVADDRTKRGGML